MISLLSRLSHVQSYERHKEQRLADARAWKAGNREKVRAYRKIYYKTNKEWKAVTDLKWARAHKNNKAASDKRYRESHIVELGEKSKAGLSQRNTRDRQRYHSDPAYCIEKRLRASLTQALRFSGARKGESVLKLVGISISALRQYLEGLFLPGMTWENRSLWHIDHKRPCASFNLTDPEQQKACFHFTNLQPLWSKDNMSKGSRWEDDPIVEVRRPK